MRSVFSWTFSIIIYAGIVLGITKGIPFVLERKLGSEEPIAAVTSGSMWPVLKVWDVVFIERVESKDLKEGDIIVWKHENGFTIHRVAQLNEKTLVTKGDANFTEDAPVPYEDVVGRAVERKNGQPLRIPYVGMLTNLGLALRGAVAAPGAITYERK